MSSPQWSKGTRDSMVKNLLVKKSVIPQGLFCFPFLVCMQMYFTSLFPKSL